MGVLDARGHLFCIEEACRAAACFTCFEWRENQNERVYTKLIALNTRNSKKFEEKIEKKGLYRTD